MNWSKEEIREYNKNYVLKNKERLKQQQLEYRIKNKESIKEKQRVHYHKNKEEYARKAKVYREKNKEKLREKLKESHKTERYKELNLIRQARYRKKNREQINIRHKIFQDKPENKTKYKKLQQIYAQKNKDKIRQKNTIYNHALKMTIMKHYSQSEIPYCKMCNEIRHEFLSIDHMNNDGAEHRKTISSGKQMYHWLRAKNYPEGYQVLCLNCQFRKKSKRTRKPLLIKHRVLSHYSKGEPICECCGEKDLVALSIDHINGGGNAHRRSLKSSERSGIAFYLWLQRNNFPSGFRVLCLSCNFSRGRFGYCPHEKERQAQALAQTETLKDSSSTPALTD
jgi:hypothetical protein